MTRRTNARNAGIAFLLYIAIGIAQMVIGSSTRAPGTAEKLVRMALHATDVRVGILLSLLICVTALVLAVSLYAITRDVDRDLAVIALCCRVGESIVTVIAPLATLGLLWLATAGGGNDAPDATFANAFGAFLLQVRVWNTTLTATLFAVGSMIFSWLFVRGRLIPAPLAWLGVVASVLLVVGLPLDLIGVVPGSTVQFLWLPMAAFEIPLGVWLIVRGVAEPRAT
jgi:hypothetical protein